MGASPGSLAGGERRHSVANSTMWRLSPAGRGGIRDPRFRGRAQNGTRRPAGRARRRTLELFAHLPHAHLIAQPSELLADRVVTIGALGMEVRFAAGEEIRTEISCTSTRGMVERMYAEAGLRLVE